MDNLLEYLLPQGLLQTLEADTLCGIAPEMGMERRGANLFHFSFVYDLPEAGAQDDCAVRITAKERPEFAWSPHLTPEEGFIVQQHVFRTPALIVQFAKKTLILLPDREILESQTTACYLDLDARSGELTIGLSRSEVIDHILYRKKSGAQYPAGKTEIAFYLMAYNERLEDPFRPVLAFYWDSYGRRDALQFAQTKKDLTPYVEHTYGWAFDRWKEIVWQEFFEDGKRMGAPVFIVTTAQSPNYQGVKKERELRSIWNQAWFCSLRSASGLFRHARRVGSQKLMEYALMTKELALAFPQEDGLFDSVVATEMEEFTQDGTRYMRSKGWETRYFGNSDRNPFTQDARTSPQHILDMSFTAEYMLLWYEELEQDVRLLDYAGRYAQRLLRLQSDSGFFPGWLDEKGAPMGVLDDSPESGMTAVFLLHYGKLTGDARFTEAALRAVEALGREIVPNGRWEDFETYWSCSAFWSDHVGEKIERNNMYKQCNLSMFYTAWAYLEAYEATGESRHLENGRRVLDEMLMTQSSYQPRGLAVPVVGGFGVMNADAELNDARQSLFSELILRFGKALGEDEYLQRGLAALRISFSMMYCPENPEAKLQWEKACPFLNELDYGFNMENYGHNGETDKDGLGIGEFTIYDWGNGAAAESYERVLDHFGEEFTAQ